MGLLSDIEYLVNGTIDHYAHVKVVPRGLPAYADSLLRGTVRFGKRTGNSVSMLGPDNTYRISSATSQTHIITLQLPTSWIQPGALISLGPGQETQQVRDVSGGTTGATTIITSGKLSFDYTNTDQVMLLATPLVVFSPVAQGATTLTVMSQYSIANGDVFSFLQTDGLIQSRTEVQITRATLLGSTSDPVYKTLYYLQLSAPLQRPLATGLVTYLRAYPAYFSSPVVVPGSLLSSQATGPFLIDLLAGRLQKGNNFTETLSAKFLDRSGNYVLGTAYDYVTIEKNRAVFERTLHAHYPLFWELDQGVMRMTPSSVIFRVAPNSLFRVGTRCTPNFPPGASWRLTAKSTENCTIRFIFAPNAPQQFTLVAGTAQTLVVNTTGTDPITNIEINISASSPSCDVSLSDWTPLTTVDRIEYSLVVQATGIASYQTTGLIIKPFFLPSDLLGTPYDLGSNYDSGRVYF